MGISSDISRGVSRRVLIAAGAAVGIVGASAWEALLPSLPASATVAPGTPLVISDVGPTPLPPPAQSVLGSAVAVAPSGGAGATGAKTLAGTGMIQPVLYDPRTSATYVGYYDPTGRATIAKRVADGTWTTAAISDGTGPVVALPGASDVHDSIATALDASGNLHVCAAMHNSDMRYWRTTRPGDLTSLTFRTSLPAAAGKWKYLVAWGNETVVTYPTFFSAQDGTLYLMFRNGQSGAGNTYLYRYSTATTAWSNTVVSGGPLLSGGGSTGFTDTPENYCAYPTVPAFHADAYGSGYHMVWVWRADPTAESNTTVHYAWTRDFTNWYPVERSPSAPTSPLTGFSHDTTATLVDATPYGGLLNGQVQVGFDSTDRVVVTYYKVNALGETKLYAARPTGAIDAPSTTWRICDITAAPNAQTNVWGDPDPATYRSSWSGTADLDHATPIYNSVPIVLNPDGTMACRYSYLTRSGGYECRRIVFSNAGTSGVSLQKTDTLDLQTDTPSAILQRDAATSSYPLAVRTSSSDSFLVPASGSWPAPAGRKVHWVLRWESGPYSAANQWGTSFPSAGTELRLYLVAEDVIASPGVLVR